VNALMTSGINRMKFKKNQQFWKIWKQYRENAQRRCQKE
jgi:hypothetical protein